MDFSATLSSRAGSTRLIAILRQLMLFDEYTISDFPEGGFSARKNFRKAKEGHAFFGLSELNVRPMGREVVVEATLGSYRKLRILNIGLMLGILVFYFIDFFFIDPEMTKAPIFVLWFVPSIICFVILLVLLMLVVLKKRIKSMLQRLWQTAVNISEIP